MLLNPWDNLVLWWSYRSCLRSHNSNWQSQVWLQRPSLFAVASWAAGVGWTYWSFRSTPACLGQLMPSLIWSLFESFQQLNLRQEVVLIFLFSSPDLIFPGCRVIRWVRHLSSHMQLHRGCQMRWVEGEACSECKEFHLCEDMSRLRGCGKVLGPMDCWSWVFGGKDLEK